MTDEIMYELMDMSGQEYVDLYASKVKAERARSAGAAASGGVRPLAPDPREAADRAPAERAG